MRGLFVVVVSWLGAAGSALAAPIVVDSNVDALSNGVCTGSPDACTLRDAITVANGASTDSDIELSAGLGAHVLTLANASGVPEDLNASGDLDILTTHNVTIVGLGATPSAIAQSTSIVDRVLHAKGGGTLTLLNVNITGGNVTGSGGGVLSVGDLDLYGVVVAENTATSHGGGVSGAGDVSLTDSFVRQNTAGLGSGGLWVSHDLVAVDSEISENVAGQSGGGAWVGGDGELIDSDVLSNLTSTGYGGGLRVNGTLYTTGGSIAYNEAYGYGGGIYADDLDMTGSTVEQNEAGNWGGGAYVEHATVLAGVTFQSNLGKWVGGGLLSEEGVTIGPDPVTSAVSEFTDNEVWAFGPTATYGGGIVVLDGFSAIESTDFTENRAVFGGGLFHNLGSLSIVDVFFAGNEAGVGGALTWGDAAVTITDSVFDANESDAGGAIYCPSNPGASGLSISTTLFQNNNSAGSGGALATYECIAATMDSVELVGNNAGIHGGGVYLGDGSSIDILKSSFLENTAATGGAFATVGHGVADIENTTFWKNVASAKGGALYLHDSESLQPWVTVRFSDLKGNESGAKGISVNGASLRLGSNILWDDCDVLSPTTRPVSLGYNLLVPCATYPPPTAPAPHANTCGLSGPNDELGLVALSAPYAPPHDAPYHHGGNFTAYYYWTNTAAPFFSGCSVPDQKADPTDCPSEDQAGTTRGADCDRGSFECVGTCTAYPLSP